MSTVRTSNSLMYVLPQHDARWLVTFSVPLRNHSLVFFLAGGQCVCRQFHANSNQLLIKGFCQIHSLVCLLPSSRKCSSCPLCSSSADLTMKIKQNAMYSDTQLAQLHDIKTRLGQLPAYRQARRCSACSV